MLWNNTSSISLFTFTLVLPPFFLYLPRSTKAKPLCVKITRGCVGMSLQLQQGNILINWTVKSIVTALEKNKKNSSNCNYLDVEPKWILGSGNTDKASISFLFASLFIYFSFLCGPPSFFWHSVSVHVHLSCSRSGFTGQSSGLLCLFLCVF